MKPVFAGFRALPLLIALTLPLVHAGCFIGGGGLPMMAYTVSDGDTAQVWVRQPGDDEGTRISSRDGDARFPRWSAEQRFLAWIARDEKSKLMLYDAAKGEVTTLVSGVEATQPPVWAPEADRIAYVAEVDGDVDIYMVELESRQKTRLTISSERERIGDWSPDGEWLVFTESGHDGLLLRNPSGVNRIELTNGPDSDPVWSPKGDRIAFLRDSDDGRDIYVLRPTKSDNWTEDTDEVAISDVDHDEFAPAWSADGRRLAFVVQFDDQSEIFVALVDGSERRQLTRNTADDLMPAWSQNGDKIAFVSYAYGNAEILYMNRDGTEQMRITTSDGMDTEPDW